MPFPVPRLPEEDGTPARRARILDAAERCFVRAGFHRTTMQDVAAEAGMSPGNLYRYFPSKDAMMAGLAERDRAQVAEDFSHLVVGDGFMQQFAALGRKHFEDEPREKAILCLEIWAEATRNPAFAEMTKAFDCDVIGRLTALFREAQERGVIGSTAAPETLALLISILANGMFVRRAVATDFDAEREVATVMNVIGAAVSGRIDLASNAWRDAQQEAAE
jgi:TetR/AcrR family transcriptional repressor of uid operon